MKDLYCPGCGALLQTENENKDGFIEKKALSRESYLCKRCYQLKHYGQFNKGKETYSTMKMVHEFVSKNDVVFFIVDLPFVITPFLKVFDELKRYNHLYLLVNRYDLYQTYISKEKAMNFVKQECKKFHLPFKAIYLIEKNCKDLIEIIDEQYPTQNRCFIGLENIGKSTFINQYLKGIGIENQFVVDSLYPGTTLQPLKIKIAEDQYLLDTPGIHSKTAFMHKIDLNILKWLQNDKKIIQTAYQLNANQSIHVNNFLSFHYLEGKKQGIIFYHSPRLTLTRCKLSNAESTFNALISQYDIHSNQVQSFKDLVGYPIEIKGNQKKDLVIEGFLFITITLPGKFVIYTFKDSNITIRNAMI